MLARLGTHILTLSNTQAKELAGRFVIIGATTYYFQNFDPAYPGQPPWRSGAEGKAYPLVDKDGQVAAYLKFFTQPTQKRLDRTAWLIGQKMYAWLPNLAAAPVLWTDTRHRLHGARIDFHFAAYLAQAVPGETWLERKGAIAEGRVRFGEDLRWRCVREMLLSLAVLEQAGLVHGDLSANNVVIDLDPPPNRPALYLIDFDAFFAPAAGAIQSVTVAEGGTYGTPGYCPPGLAAAARLGKGAVAPYSDRYGRDMLLLEFLLMGNGLPADDPLADWNREQLQRQFAAWRARSDPVCVHALRHLDPATVFLLSEPERPTSVELASSFGVLLPGTRALRRVTELPRPTPALLGCPSIEERQGSRRPAIEPFYRRRNRLPRELSRNMLVGVVVLIGAIMMAIYSLFLLGMLRPPEEMTREEKEQQAREQGHSEAAWLQAEEKRQEAYAQYKEHNEAEGSPVKSYDEWRSNDTIELLGYLSYVLIPITVFAAFVGWAATRDPPRDYDGRNAARMVAFLQGSKRRRP